MKIACVIALILSALRLSAVEQIHIKAMLIESYQKVNFSIEDIENNAIKKNRHIKILQSTQLVTLSGQEGTISIGTLGTLRKAIELTPEKEMPAPPGFELKVLAEINAENKIKYSIQTVHRVPARPRQLEGLTEDQVVEHKLDFKGECNDGESVLKRTEADAKGRVQYLYLKFTKIDLNWQPVKAAPVEPAVDGVKKLEKLGGIREGF